MTQQVEGALIDLLRETARKEILPRYRSLGQNDVRSKSSASDLVTIADTNSEKRIAAGLSRIFPNACVVGEEAVSDNPEILKNISDADLAVIVDPIDGTWNFAKGLPLFGIILAVVRQGETVFGLLYDPVMDHMTLAHRGYGAHHLNRSGIRTRIELQAPERCDLSEMTGILPLFLLPEPQKTSVAAKLAAFDRVMSYRCACHEYRILAEGAVDFSLSGQLKPWDHAAGEFIYREAGGFSALMENEAGYKPALGEGQLLLARNRDCWLAVRDHLADAF